MGIAIILMILGLVIAVNYARYRDALYPGVVQPAAWTGILCLYWLNQDLMDPLSGLAYTIIVAGTVTFSLGAHLGARGRTAPKVRIPEIPFAPKPWYDRLLFWGPIIGLGPYLYTAYLVGQSGPFDNFYLNLRVAATDPDNQTAGGMFGILAYLLPLSYAAVMLHTLLGTYRRDKATYGIVLLVALVYAFFSTGRTQFVLLFIALLGLLLLTRRIRPTKAVVRGGLLILGTFVGLGTLVGKSGDNFSSVGTAIRGFYEVIVAYMVGSLPAFDLYIHTHGGMDWGRHTFRTFFAVLNKLGANLEVEPLIQEFVQVPFPTNVYTMYQPYFDDFALAGVFLMPLVLGLLHGWLYRRATQGHPLFLLLYALSLSPMIMQYYSEGYFTSLSMWIQYTALFFLYFYRLEIIPEGLKRAGEAVHPPRASPAGT